MIDESKQSTTIKVCLDDAGTHNRAILDFFFAKLGQHIFRCVETQEESNVLLIDYDYPPARKRYEEEYVQWQKPALILSISEVSLENAIWLAKPLTSRALLDAAETLQKQVSADMPPTVANPISNSTFTAADSANLIPEAVSTVKRPQIKEQTLPVNVPLVDIVDESKLTPLDSEPEIPADEVLPSNSTKETSLSEEDNQEVAQTKPISKVESEARIINLCGESQDLLPNTDMNEHYQDDSFFLSSLKDAIRLARQCQQGVLLNFPQARIYVLPEIHRVFCGVDIYDDEFIELIKSCSVSEGGKMHILSTREIHELNDMISQQASALYDLEAFVWTSSLLSAKGSLPRTLDPNKPVALKHWPSLTRLENFPNAMPIAAQWSASAMSAFDMSKSLNIPQRYVFSFYNAANSLGLIEQDPEKLINKQSAPRTKDAPRGLFSRLLKRLVGG